MRLLVQACSLLNAQRLFASGVDGVIVGTSQFASRLPGDVNLAEIKALVDQKLPVIVSVNNLFDESQLPALENYLEELNRIGAKDVVFHDYAIAYINQEKKLGLNLVYNSETLVTSHGQLPFFARNGIKRVALARELLLPEIVQVAKGNTTEVQLEVQVHGLMFVMQSKWNLLLNYKEYLQDKNLDISQQSQFMIREDTRKMGNFIYEDVNGTHMFTGYELCALEVLNQLYDAKIDCVRIDCAMKDQQWIESAAEVYVKALRLLKEGILSSEQITEMRLQLEQNAGKVPLYLGFYGGPKTNPHFERSE